MLSNWPYNNPCTSHLLAPPIISSNFNTLSFVFLSHPSFCFSVSLSSLPFSDVMPLCQWGGAEGERRNESGSQEAMHLKSPLCHNKEEIDLGLACSPIPFSPKPRRMDGRTHTQHTHTHRAESVHEFIQLLASASFLTKQQVHPRTGSLPWTTISLCAWVYVWLFNSVSQFLQGHDCNLEKTLNFNWQFKLSIIVNKLSIK